jgi:hypothetical protein
MDFTRKLMRRSSYLRQAAATLPNGVVLYQIGVDGNLLMIERGVIRSVSPDDGEIGSRVHPFINPGNEAFYLVGDPHSGPSVPSHATAKFGRTHGHHSFVPHAHGVDHLVYATGYSGCVLYDREKSTPCVVALKPGTALSIPGMQSHAFFNREEIPLVTLIVNAGLGISHRDYAITLDIARDRLARGEDDGAIAALVVELEAIGRLMQTERPEHQLSLRERGARFLARLARLLDP